MKQLRGWLARLAGLFHPGRHEGELAAELESHLQMHIDDMVRAGVSPQEARREALRQLGGVETTKQAYREGSTLPSVESLAQDIRFAIRQLRRNPGFAGIAVLLLMVGIGASVAIFCFVDAALIRPLPYRDPTRLVHVTESAGRLIPRANLSYLDYLDWKKLNKVFSDFDVYTGDGYILRTPSGTDTVTGVRVSPGFFRTLGVAPMLGRDFRAGEDHAGTNAMAGVETSSGRPLFSTEHPT
jgi:macrolide transport system ATP-binding/permease protein